MKTKIDPSPSASLHVVDAFDAWLNTQITNERSLCVELIAYGIGARRIERCVAFTPTFRVVAYYDPETCAVKSGEVPFKSYCTLR